ncbi:UDP-glucose/GDP-mannose dehydrogenase family protein [bacterium]|nr:UDP-glucose/GDP-mannose dehydrogenase family protein [bacterium]
MTGKRYKIAIIGTGFVGLATGAGLAELGNEVICADVNKDKIDSLNNGYLPIYEDGLPELINKNKKLGRISFTTDIALAVKASDIIFVCVGTPSEENGEVDLSQIESATVSIGEVLDRYKIIAVKSTIPIGTLDLMEDILEREGKVKGRDYDLAVVPEFLREGRAVYDFFNPTRIVIGTDKESVDKILTEIFLPLNAPIVHTSPITAQVIKYASNAFLAARISFINEIADICDHIGANVNEVIEGMKYDKRIGGDYFSPGIGFGGPCLIKDLSGFIKMVEKYGYQANYLRSILDKNNHQIKYFINKLKKLLGGLLKDKIIGVLGLTFKPNTNDVRNSLAIEIIKELKKNGANIKAYDPKGLEEAKKYLDGIILCDDIYKAIEGVDALIILTAWEEFKEIDLERLKSQMKSPIILDGVNLLNPKRVKNYGFIYEGIGVK